jgi:uncharacterized metal-binding protein
MDGCPSYCGTEALQHAGCDDIRHPILTGAGFEKGSSPASPVDLCRIEHGKNLMG